MTTHADGDGERTGKVQCQWFWTFIIVSDFQLIGLGLERLNTCTDIYLRGDNVTVIPD